MSMSNPPANASPGERLPDACLRPGFFGPGETVAERIDTHISWVFLTDEHAYKFKKPVRFEFLDFSTPDLRRAACEAEVRLNRRLADDVYRGVFPVTCDTPGQLAFDGQGTVVDWCVAMRRLPAGETLADHIADTRATPDDGHRVARRLATFYANLPPSPISAAQYRERIEAHVRANFAELARPAHGLSGAQVTRIHSAQLLLLLTRPELFAARVDAGRVVEGHGDLRPEHIVLTEPPTIFDCLEFSLDLRTIDVADELAFLAMECDRLGAPEIGRAVLDETLRAVHDEPDSRLVHFYKSYRACVRAKVAALRAAQLTGDDRRAALADARRDLDLADRYVGELGLPSPLFIVRGLSGSGKSTLARAIAAATLARHLSTDDVRRELLGASASPSDFQQGLYRPELRARVYDELHARAGAWLANGVPVVLDGTYLRRQWWQAAVDLAHKCRAQIIDLHCVCPDDVALARIAQRALEGRDTSEVREDLYERQREEAQEHGPDGRAAFHVETTRPLEEQLREVWKCVRIRGS